MQTECYFTLSPKICVFVVIRTFQQTRRQAYTRFILLYYEQKDFHSAK